MNYVDSLPVIPVDDIMGEYSSASHEQKMAVSALLQVQSPCFLLSVIDIEILEAAIMHNRLHDAHTGCGIYAGSAEYIAPVVISALAAVSRDGNFLDHCSRAVSYWISQQGSEFLKQIVADTQEYIDAE